MAEKRILLKDIAEKAGLTINTVSRALKDKSDISPSTRQEVKRLAVEMGYIPDVIASSLRSGFTRTIGIMFDNIANPYFMIMTELIYEQLRTYDYDLMIFTSSGDHAQFDMSSFNKMVSRRIDGIITFLKPTQDVVKAVLMNQVPLVILGREGDDIGIDSVYTDDYYGGFQVGKYLYEKNHKSIGYIGAPHDILCSVKRHQGLTDFLKSIEIDPPKVLTHFLEHGDLSLLPPIKKMLEEKITALFCFNDTMAYEAMTILNEQGYHVPNDVSVIGYDNLEERLPMPICLTTVDTNKLELTEKAITLLLRRINDFNAPMKKLVNASKLIVRKTA